jgi:hypothetical protein
VDVITVEHLFAHSNMTMKSRYARLDADAKMGTVELKDLAGVR